MNLVRIALSVMNANESGFRKKNPDLYRVIGEVGILYLKLRKNTNL